MANIILKSEDQGVTHYTFTLVGTLDREENPRWVEHEIGGRSGSIQHWTGASDGLITMTGLLPSTSAVETVRAVMMTGLPLYLDVSAHDSNLSGKVTFVEFVPKLRPGASDYYDFRIVFKEYNNP